MTLQQPASVSLGRIVGTVLGEMHTSLESFSWPWRRCDQER